MPVIEAMATGTPVACSTGGSLGEVVEDAAGTWEPGDTDTMETVVRRLLGDPGHRTELTERGRLRAERFTWERTAADTLEVYKELLGEEA